MKHERLPSGAILLGAPEPLTILVETPRGTLRREIPDASPLPLAKSDGKAAEAATSGAAGVWGLPDFVFRAAERDVGSGTREAGDVLVVVGDLAVVVQVKRRDKPGPNSDRETKWLGKNIKRAISQANGSIRWFRRRPFELTNLRGRVVTFDPNDLRFLTVVVIDHPDPPEHFEPDLTSANDPCVVLLRRDWEFLFEQLKSAHLVGGYLERVADEARALGDEPVRYFELAADDHGADPDPLPENLARGRVRISEPLLPMSATGSERSLEHRMFRVLLEDIASIRLRNSTEARRSRMLGELDALPVEGRANVGEFLLDGLAKIAKTPPGYTHWELRSIIGSRRTTQLGFGVCSKAHDGVISDLFAAWVQLRHYDMTQLLGTDELTTVGVLLTPRNGVSRPYDTTMIAAEGEIDFDEEMLRELRKAWPNPTQADEIDPGAS